MILLTNDSSDKVKLEGEYLSVVVVYCVHYTVVDGELNSIRVEGLYCNVRSQQA